MPLVRRALTAAVAAVAVWSLTLVATVAAPNETIEIPDQALLHFDPSRISQDRLLELALLSPYMLWTFGEADCARLEDDDAPCDPESTALPDFLDADAELNDVEAMLEDVSRLHVPPQLDGVLLYVRRQASFQLCLRRAELEYSRGDDGALTVICDDVVASEACPEPVAETRSAWTLQRRYDLATGAWRQCMSEAFYRHHGAYPFTEWQGFLEANGIEEEALHGC